eukprot:CAMPEP_0180155132 /NCGR_PEP_ID=MMETSP0986-20121125/24617_1 /TAXON_ID=697907 /ORGANISM="non described non described, Strain CCMP2293" /LENGTH=267 /DNA_ID=CAMNT_0022103709 /DNA_START=20 /DNA_END=823 /DNA_ORIENTATION=+
MAAAGVPEKQPELAKVFLGYPNHLSNEQMEFYERMYADNFKAIVPSASGELGGLATLDREQWIGLQKAFARGLPDWDYRGKIWRPIDEEEWDEEVIDKKDIRHVHLLTEIRGTHTGDGPNLLKLEGCDYKPTAKVVVWPKEWWRITITQDIPASILELRFIKALDTSGCSTGGYSLVPGCLFSIGKPLPPSAAALQHPFPCFPPLDAVDVQDPNWWQLRLELFKQITDKTAEQKAEIKRLIDRQLAELQQHLDYLNAVEIACGDRPK